MFALLSFGQCPNNLPIQPIWFIDGRKNEVAHGHAHVYNIIDLSQICKCMSMQKGERRRKVMNL
jgi:hypothetical protein